MLKAEGLTYHLNGKSLVENINLTFKPGILYGILGPNGSGKSSLLKTLTGIWSPTSGKVIWKGENLLSQARQQISKTISLVAQQQPMHFDFTVIDLVTMGRYSHGNMPKKQIADLIAWALNLVDISHLQNRYVSELSQGERQRVYIARALATESPVLALDEPTSSLDIRHQLEIWKLLKQLVSQGKIIIVTNHDLVATGQHCEQVAIMNNGNCIACGEFKKIVTAQLLESVFGVVKTNVNNAVCFELP